MRKKITELIKNSFEAHKLSYKTLMDTEEVTIFATGFESESKSHIITQVYVYDDHIKIQGTLSNPVRYPHRKTVGEFLQFANTTVKIGYYLFDYFDYTINFVHSFKMPSEYTDEAFRDDISIVVQMLEYIYQPVKDVASGSIGPEEAYNIFKGGVTVEKEHDVRRDSEGSDFQTGQEDNAR